MYTGLSEQAVIQFAVRLSHGVVFTDYFTDVLAGFSPQPFSDVARVCLTLVY